MWRVRVRPMRDLPPIPRLRPRQAGGEELKSAWEGSRDNQGWMAKKPDLTRKFNSLPEIGWDILVKSLRLCEGEWAGLAEETTCRENGSLRRLHASSDWP